jgi:hypothetical protein
MATIRDDHFILESMNPARHCTPVSVAAHSLYEQPSPFEVVEPGGRLDMSTSTYVAEDEHRTRVAGSKWETMPYTLKLEGVRKIGYRCFSMGAMRCPIGNAQVDTVIKGVEDLTRSILKGKYDESDYRLKFRLYGRDGIMQEREPNRDFQPNEIFVLTDVVGKTQAIADGVCSVARYYLLHYFYKDIQATAGNVAVPFVPCDIPLGEVFEFSIYHLVEESDPLVLFPIKQARVKAGDLQWLN